MRRFCLQNVESILGDTKKDLPKRTGPFIKYVRVILLLDGSLRGG